MVLGQNSGVWAVFIGWGLLVSADVTQPIQNIFGIGWIKSVDTINLIIGIGWHNSIDTKNVLGIRGVTRRRKTLIAESLRFCAIRLPHLGAASLDPASLDATPLLAAFFPVLQKLSLQRLRRRSWSTAAPPLRAVTEPESMTTELLPAPPSSYTSEPLHHCYPSLTPAWA
jgi:hypothetical protein